MFLPQSALSEAQAIPGRAENREKDATSLNVRYGQRLCLRGCGFEKAALHEP